MCHHKSLNFVHTIWTLHCTASTVKGSLQCMQCQQSGAIPVWWCMWCSNLLKCGGVVMVQQLQVSDHRPAEPLQGTT